jgi:hypothetical protein
MAKNDGGRAFARAGTEHGSAQGGMSIRTWLAGLAMQGMLASADCNYQNDKLAEYAFNIADAMIKEGEK